jgi:hypothetical protein
MWHSCKCRVVLLTALFIVAEDLRALGKSQSLVLDQVLSPQHVCRLQLCISVYCCCVWSKHDSLMRMGLACPEQWNDDGVLDIEHITAYILVILSF